MSANFNKVKEYLLDLEYRIVTEDHNDEIVIVEKEEEGIVNLILDCEDSILIIESLLFEMKEEASQEALRSLLIKNREIVHGAFALDETGKRLIFRDTLQLNTLDINELEASINSLKLLLSEYGEELTELSNL